LRDGDHCAKKPSLGPTKNSVCMLTPSEEITYGINLCEGVEDALTLYGLGWLPTWATCGKNTMASFFVDGIDAALFWADNDKDGLEAAHTGKLRWLDAGREAGVAMLDDYKDLGEFARARASRYG